MKKDDVYPSKWLKVSDVGPGLVLTITGAQEEMFKVQGSETEKEKKLVIGFAETKKRFTVNKTNFDLIAKATGEDDTDNWTGKRIKIIVEEVEAFGKPTEGMRVESAPKAKVKK